MESSNDINEHEKVESGNIFKNPLWDEIVKNLGKPKMIGCRIEFYEMTGNLHAAILLDKLFYWHLPPKAEKKDSSKSRLTLNRDGFMWLGKRRNEWEDIGLTVWQYDVAIGKLRQLGFVETVVSKYRKKKQILIRLTNKFVEDYSKCKLGIKSEISDSPNPEIPFRRSGSGDIADCQDSINENRCFQITNTPKSEKSNFLYTSNLVTSFLEENTSSFENFEKYILPPKERYKDKIGNTAEIIFTLLESSLQPISVFNNYSDIMKEYRSYLRIPRGYYGPILSETEIWIQSTGIEPTEETTHRIVSIWDHFDCKEMRTEKAPMNGLNSLMFTLRAKFFEWLPRDIGHLNLESVLFAMIAYYQKHEKEYKWPKEILQKNLEDKCYQASLGGGVDSLTFLQKKEFADFSSTMQGKMKANAS